MSERHGKNQGKVDQPPAISSEAMPSPGKVRSEIQTLLKTRKETIYREMELYPTPIPACDQHFNFLIEERNRISAELRRLELEVPPDQTREQMGKSLDSFRATSPVLDDP